jgi:hypothetical protein
LKLKIVSQEHLNIFIELFRPAEDPNEKPPKSYIKSISSERKVAGVLSNSNPSTRQIALEAKEITMADSSSENIAKIQSLLRAKDDTKRFVGLALLKSVLDNPSLQQDDQTIQSLWASLSPVFLDRLLRTGSKASTKNAKEMLDLAVSILHTFAVLLPDASKTDAKFLDRIPGLVNAVLYRYGIFYYPPL